MFKPNVGDSCLYSTEQGVEISATIGKVYVKGADLYFEGYCDINYTIGGVPSVASNVAYTSIVNGQSPYWRETNSF